MEIKYHKDLTDSRWFKFSFDEQMGNIGSEIGRAISWRQKDKKVSRLAFERGLELLDLTIIDPNNEGQLSALSKLKKDLVDYFYSSEYSASFDETLNNYFHEFMYKAALIREKSYL